MEYLKFGTAGGKIVIGRDRRKYYEFNHKVTFPGSADGPFFLILKLCIGCDARLEAIQKLKKSYITSCYHQLE